MSHTPNGEEVILRLSIPTVLPDHPFTMGWYHALAAESTDLPSTVYHLCPKAHWDERKAIYYPQAYDEDKFTRSMHDPSRLVETANCFYQDSDDEEWICLEIATIGLRASSIEIKMESSAMDPTLKCPHIFGGLPREAVRKVYPCTRGEDGTFLFIAGLSDTCCNTKVEM